MVELRGKIQALRDHADKYRGAEVYPYDATDAFCEALAQIGVLRGGLSAILALLDEPELVERRWTLSQILDAIYEAQQKWTASKPASLTDIVITELERTQDDAPPEEA